MADLAVGHINGVAKEADLTVVQMDDFSNEILRRLGWTLVIDALSQVADDISNRGLGNSPVVLMAFTTTKGQGDAYQEVFENAFISILQALDSHGVTLVAAVPNEKQCDSLPCILGDPNHAHHMPNLITVGEGLINDGDYGSPDDDLEDWVTVYGPGDDRSGGDYWDPGFDCAAPVGIANSGEGQGGTSYGKQNTYNFHMIVPWLIAFLCSVCHGRRPDGILQRVGSEQQ